MKMLSLAVDVELLAGVPPEQATSDMVELANRIGCKVVGSFNGITMWCYPNDEVERIMKNYHRAIKMNDHHKIVSSTLPRDKDSYIKMEK